MISGRTRKAVVNVLFYLCVACVVVIFLFPLCWMVLSSLKTQVQNISYPPVFVFKPTLENYRTVFIKNPYLRYTYNSAVVAGGATLFSLLLGLPASFSIARFKQQWIAMFILIGRIMPGVAALIPWYILFARLGLIDTYLGLILTHMVQVFPLVVWIMISFFEDIPIELEEAARVDGCSILGAFFRIILPLSSPGMAAAAILAFIFSWNNFMFSLVIASHRTWTLPVAAYNFIGYGEVNWGGLTAAATVITLPVLILTLLIQRFIVRGLTFGALKG